MSLASPADVCGAWRIRAAHAPDEGFRPVARRALGDEPDSLP